MSGIGHVILYRDLHDRVRAVPGEDGALREFEREEAIAFTLENERLVPNEYFQIVELDEL